MTSMKRDLDTALEVTRREGIEQGREQGGEFVVHEVERRVCGRTDAGGGSVAGYSHTMKNSSM